MIMACVVWWVHHKEPYGTVYGEAMAAGLPVVSWRAGNLAASGRARTRSFDRRADTGLSTALERLSEDGELRARLGQAARQRASDPADLGRLSPISLPRCADFDAELSHNAPQIRRTLLSLPGAARQSRPAGCRCHPAGWNSALA